MRALAGMLNQAAGPSATSTAQANDDCLFSVKVHTWISGAAALALLFPGMEGLVCTELWLPHV